jgi:hypothetical protein
MDAGYTEPPEHERVYYRHVSTSDMAYAVTKEGKPYIKYDRPNEERVLPFNPSNWIAVDTYRPIPEAQLVQVAFEADKRLCLLLGYHDLARREWIGLTETQRIKWMRHGPQVPPVRQRLFQAIKDVLNRIDDPEPKPPAVKKKKSKKKKVNGSNTKKG